MNFLEAMTEMRKGRRVREIDWGKMCFLEIKHNIIFNQWGEYYTFDNGDYLSCRWEKY